MELTLLEVYLIYLQEKEWDEDEEFPDKISVKTIANVIGKLSGSGKLAAARHSLQPRLLNIYVRNALGDYLGRANTQNSYNLQNIGLDKLAQIKSVLKKAIKFEKDLKPEEFLKNIITVSDKSNEPVGRELGVSGESDDGYSDSGDGGDGGDGGGGD